ncbi:MAG: methyltransferase [Thermoplasmata archaeon]|jgi:release factor glutamine methyltransferase|nr:methyltransferase [Thermoplasmata archaeon]
MTSELLRRVQIDHSIGLDVQEEVYNPSDDSYLLLKVVEVSPGDNFLDMGSGTGIIGIHAAKAGAKVICADHNPYAVECTRRNAARNEVRLEAVRSDLFESLSGLYDVIAFNPPYLPGKQSSTSWIERSWAGGEEGSELTIRFLEDAWRHLLPGGRIYVVLSSAGGFMSVLKAAKARYSAEMLEEHRMFFESIFAYRFAVRSSQSQ